MLCMPQQYKTPGVGQEGDSDAHPLNLQGVPKADFTCLLSVIYPQFPIQSPFLSSEWMAVLELATRWRMRALRLFCVEKLNDEFNSKTPIEQVAMARKFMATEWLIKAYDALVKRDALISVEDLAQLGQTEGFHLLYFQATWMRNQMQEAASNRYGYHGKLFESKQSSDFTFDIIPAFHDELVRLDAYDMDSKTTPSSPHLGFEPDMSPAGSPVSIDASSFEL